MDSSGVYLTIWVQLPRSGGPTVQATPQERKERLFDAPQGP